MPHTYPIHTAFYHLLNIVGLIIMTVVVINNFASEYNDPTSLTYKMMMMILQFIFLIGCIYTGRQLKKHKITYKK
jgi:uncharacterized phage infection (PIP) family protein YhgE